MGPLHGYRIVEFAGIGPAPMAAMLLADMGATVLRIDRPEQNADLGIEKPARFNLLNRGREILAPAEADRLPRAMATFKRLGPIHTFRDQFLGGMRPEERRVGEAWVSPRRSRWSAAH